MSAQQTGVVVFIPSGGRGFGRWDLWWQNYHHTFVFRGLPGRSLTLPPPGRFCLPASLLPGPRTTRQYFRRGFSGGVILGRLACMKAGR